MKSMIVRALGAVGLIVLAGTPALAGGGGSGQGQITDGDSTYTFLGFADGAARWEPGEPVTGNQLFQSWWWYRVDAPAAQGHETSFGNGQPDNRTFTGNTATFSGTEENVLGPGAGGDLLYEITWTVNGSRLDSTLTVTNTTNQPLTMSLFHYGDVDVNGAPDDVADVDDDFNVFISDVSTPNVFVQYSGSDPDLYMVSPRGPLIDSLNDDSTTTFNNTNEVMSPSDVTAGFQWIDVIIPAGETENFEIGFNVIPTPGAAGLLALASLGAMRRRRA